MRPWGGEEGQDGYFDAEYTSQSGDVIRMVSRDVFDVGIYSYPKRFEGQDTIHHSELWTEDERRLRNWLSKFGVFHGHRIRM